MPSAYLAYARPAEELATCKPLGLAIVGKTETENIGTEQSHAAYLGKELAKAELSLGYDFKFIQDGA